MKIFLNSKERDFLSTEERDKILTLIRNQGLSEVTLIDSIESDCATEKDGFLSALRKETLLANLSDLQIDALNLEEQVNLLRDRNDYLEEKVNWLRSKLGNNRDTFESANIKRGPDTVTSRENIHAALALVINKLESQGSGKAGFSFIKSKRARKNRILISNSEYYDEAYLAKELQELGLDVNDPLGFFVVFGGILEISPSERFDTKAYLSMNPDVKESGINPLLHYIKHGKAEGRVLI